VLCADEVVHKLYAAGGAAVAPVGAAFPIAVVEGAIDRPALSNCVVGNEAAMKQLESIVHPLVEQERAKFIQEVCQVQQSQWVVERVLVFLESFATGRVCTGTGVAAKQQVSAGNVVLFGIPLLASTLCWVTSPAAAAAVVAARCSWQPPAAV
jgi:dephospho-CoA kinase